MQKQEDFKNQRLAQLLTGLGIPTDYEQRSGRRKLDVVSDVDGLRVVLEAETGFNKKAQAIKDADARLRQKLSTLVFALCYPDNTTADNLAEQTLTWTVRTKAGAPSGQWSIGKVAQLAQAVQQAPSSLSGADVAAQILSDSLDSVVQRMKSPTRRAIAQSLDLPQTKIDQENNIDGYFVAAKRGMLVVATAMLFHHRLQNHLPGECPEGYDGPWPPLSSTVCGDQTAPISAFQEAWRGILAVDYRPVFETGRAALAALSADPDMGQAVSSLARTIDHISQLVAGLRHDLLGRIFHRVLDTARYDGSFYTSTAAATLLASLALREEDINWSDPNAVASLRICDPACGTGTLLMAAAERIRDLRAPSGLKDAEAEEALGLILVEDVLWGYDVNLTATHMAASTLGMLSPSTKFNRMNVHRALLGVFDGEAYLGSLDFLHSKPRLAHWPSATQQVESGEGMEAPPPPMDLVIMNPPFTRDSLRHDQFNRKDEIAIKKREQALFAGRPTYMAGNSGAFLVLAEHLTKANAGTVAAVLPLVGITDKSGLEIRKFLGSRFHVESIVSSHDPNRIFFSENTSIGEVLLVCRRWSGDGPKPATRVVNLARNPATPMEALDTAGRIEKASEGEGQIYDFTIQWVESERIEKGEWLAVNFLSPFLMGAYRDLNKSSLASVPTVPLGSLAEVGPEGRRIRDAYTYSHMPTPSGRRALWHHKTDVTRSMLSETDVYVEPKESKVYLANNYWEQRSRLLLSSQLRLNLARVSAVMLPELAVGSRWIPCRPYDPELAKALCLFLNSTLGLLALLGSRDNRLPSYASFSLDTLRSLPVPDLSKLEKAQLDLLDSWFDWLASNPLMPLPRMQEDPVRIQIDDAVTTALGLDPDWVATVRHALAREPSVTNARLPALGADAHQATGSSESQMAFSFENEGNSRL